MNANSPNKTTPPQAYIDHVQNFYGRDFYVDNNVLSPRPESEQIIDTVKSLSGLPYLPGVKPEPPQLPPHPIILDVGTGSGCLAITLALELTDAKIYATVISKPALKIAQKNAHKLGAPITLIISHLLEKVKDSTIPFPDLIVANLPYVDQDWPWLDKTALSYEPSLALYAKDHGLALIKELIDESSALRIPYLILEADPSQHQAIIEYASAHHYTHVTTHGFILTLQIDDITAKKI